MKRIVSILMCLSLCMGVCSSQTLSKLFENNQEMTEIFVNPLGIENAVETNDVTTIESEMKKLGLQFKSMDFPILGHFIGIAPEKFVIADVEINQIMILVQNDMNGIIYISAPSDKYEDLAEYLEKSLAPYAISKGALSASSNGSETPVYMLSDKYGVAVKSLSDKKTVMFMLIDMKNLQGFLSLGSLFGK